MKFSSLQQNTSQKQLKRGRIYFGSGPWDTVQHSKNICGRNLQLEAPRDLREVRNQKIWAKSKAGL